MIASAEFTPDFRVRARGQHFREIHGDLARPNNCSCAAFGRHFTAVNPVKLAYGTLNLVNRDPAAIGRKNIGQLLLGQLQGHFLSRQLRVSDEFIEAANQLANIASDGAREEIDHIIGHGQRGKAGQFRFENFAPQFDISGLNIGHQSH